MTFKAGSSDGSEDLSLPHRMVDPGKFLRHNNAKPRVPKDGGGGGHGVGQEEGDVDDVDVFLGSEYHVTKSEGKEGLVERRACSGRRLRVYKGEKQPLSWFTRYESQLVGVCCNLQLIQQDTRYTYILYNRTNKLQLNQVHVHDTIPIFISSNTKCLTYFQEFWNLLMHKCQEKF
jgi:hypothetical protein